MHAGTYKDEMTTTLYNIGADVCHTKLAAFVKLCGESFKFPRPVQFGFVSRPTFGFAFLGELYDMYEG